MHIHVHTNMYDTHRYLQTHTNMYTHINMYTHTQIHSCTHTRVHTRTHPRTQSLSHLYTYTHRDIHCIRTQILACIHCHMRAHKHIRAYKTHINQFGKIRAQASGAAKLKHQARRKNLESSKAKSGCGLFVGVWGRCFNLEFLAVSFFFTILQNCKYQEHTLRTHEVNFLFLVSVRIDFACRSTKLIFCSWSACGSISGAGRFRVRVHTVNFLFLVSVRVDFACRSVSLGSLFRVRVDFACVSISRAVNLWTGNEYKGLGASEYLFKK